MKKLITIVLFASFVLSASYGYSQRRNNTRVRLPKEECITILKDSYLFMYFGYPADTTATLNRFVATVAGIVPMSKEKKDRIKDQALAAVKKQTIGIVADITKLNPQTEKISSVSDEVFFLTQRFFPDNYIALLGGNVNDVIKANFNADEHTLIHKTLLEDRWKASQAYFDLNYIFETEDPEKSTGLNIPMEKHFEVFTRIMFDYYNIR